MQTQLLMIVHHRNLVSLIGYCDEDESKALIYEYMTNGSLQQHLFGNLYLPPFGPPPFEYNIAGSSIRFLKVVICNPLG